jgi:tRNA(Arg) A34 adenosine deaminase TadA
LNSGNKGISIMNNENIKESGVKELEKIGLENENISKWKSRLLYYEFNDAYPDDTYVWLTDVLALKAVDSGNFGVGCILVDFHSNVVVQGHNEVFNPYFRSDRHAEMVVMDDFEDTHRQFLKLQGYTLYTSLESCPMCLVRLITSGVSKVFHAAPDMPGGMVREMKNLPQFWLDLNEGKVFSQARCSPELINAANEIFLLNVNELIEKIKNMHASKK